jgi:hypothetical protein
VYIGRRLRQGVCALNDWNVASQMPGVTRWAGPAVTARLRWPNGHEKSNEPWGSDVGISGSERLRRGEWARSQLFARKSLKRRLDRDRRVSMPDRENLCRPIDAC